MRIDDVSEGSGIDKIISCRLSLGIQISSGLNPPRQTKAYPRYRTIRHEIVFRLHSVHRWTVDLTMVNGILLVVVCIVLLNRHTGRFVCARSPYGVLSDDNDANVSESLANAADPVHDQVAGFREVTIRSQFVSTYDDGDQSVDEQREIQDEDPECEGLLMR